MTTRRIVLGSALAMPFLVRPASAATKVQFRLDWTIYGSHAPFYLALVDKMFDQAGLDVGIGEGQGSATIARLVGQGADVMGFIDFGSTALAVAAGVPLVALARVLSDNMAMISHSDAAIRTPKELENHVVAYAPSESTAQMMPALLKQNDVDAAKVGVLNPATGAKNAMFLQRRADAIPVSVNVQPAQLEAQGAKLQMFRFSDFGVSLMNNGVVANRDWLAANQEAARAFLRVVAEAFAATRKDPARAIDAIVRAAPQQARNREVLARQLDLTFPLLETRATAGKPFGTMAAEDWTGMQSLMTKYAGLSREVPAGELYTNALLA